MFSEIGLYKKSVFTSMRNKSAAQLTNLQVKVWIWTNSGSFHSTDNEIESPQSDILALYSVFLQEENWWTTLGDTLWLLTRLLSVSRYFSLFDETKRLLDQTFVTKPRQNDDEMMLRLQRK